MPKNIGYKEASKLSSSRIRRKSKDEAALKKTVKTTPRTEAVIRQLIKAGFTEKEARARVDKQKGKK